MHLLNKRRQRLLGGVIATLAFWTPDALGDDIFNFQGLYTRASGGAHQTESRSGAANIHNPANLSLSPTNGYVDVGMTRMSYEYAPTDDGIDPGQLVMPLVPLTSFGGSWRPTKKLGLGAIFVPLGMPGAKNKISKFPFKSGGVAMNADMEAEETSYRAGLGAGYQFSREFRIGLGLLYHHKSSKVTVLSPDTGEPAVVLGEQGKYITPKLGMGGFVPSYGTWGMSYRPAMKPKYLMTMELVGSESAESVGKYYVPEVYGAGASLRVAPLFQPYFDYSYERWIPGTFESTPPLALMSGKSVPTDFQNTHNIVLGAKSYVGSKQHFYGSFGYFGANKGAGVQTDEQELVYAGIGPRDFEAMRRQQYTFGYSNSLKQQAFTGYLSYITAAAEAPEETPGAGSYKLNMIMAGGGLMFR